MVCLSIRAGSLVTLHCLLVWFFRCYFNLNSCWQRRLQFATWTRLGSGYWCRLLGWCWTVPEHICRLPSRQILLDYRGSCLQGKPGMWLSPFISKCNLILSVLYACESLFYTLGEQHRFENKVLSQGRSKRCET